MEIFRTRKCSFDTLSFEGIIKKSVVVFSVCLFCFIFFWYELLFQTVKANLQHKPGMDAQGRLSRKIEEQR